MRHHPFPPSPPPAVFTWIVRLYPRRWRERYEQEMLALLEQHPATVRTYLSLLWCALETRLDPYFVAKELDRMLQAVRTSILAVVWAGLAFLLASIGFVQMANGVSAPSSVRSVFGPSSLLLTITAFLALLALFAGSLPIVIGLVRYALTTHRLRLVFPLAVPVGALAFLMGTTALIEHVVGPNRTVLADPLPDSATDLGGNLGLFLWLSVLFLALLASGVAVVRTVTGVPLDTRLWRFTLAPAAILTVAMAVVTSAAVLFGLPIWTRPDTLPPPTLVTMTSPWWLTSVTVMGMSTAIAAASVLKGIFALRQAPAVTGEP